MYVGLAVSTLIAKRLAHTISSTQRRERLITQEGRELRGGGRSLAKHSPVWPDDSEVITRTHTHLHTHDALSAHTWKVGTASRALSSQNKLQCNFMISPM